MNTRALGSQGHTVSEIGRGFLAAGAANLGENDFRRSLPRFKGEALEQNLSLFDALSQLAKHKPCTPAQLALAWLLHKGTTPWPFPAPARFTVSRRTSPQRKLYPRPKTWP